LSDSADGNFDSLMREMGVRRLDSAGGGKKSGKRKSKGRVARGPARSAASQGAPVTPAPAPAVAPVPAPVRPAPARPAPLPPAPGATSASRGPAAASAAVSAGTDQKVLEGLRAELVRLRDGADGLQDEADGLRAELDRVRTERDNLDAERRGLQRRLTESQGDVPPPIPRLSDVFTARGVLGELEAARLLEALIEARRIGQLLELLQPSDVARLEAFLDDRVALLGGCDACPSAMGRAVVTVPRERCDVCAGSDIKRAVRMFIDACLVNGATRVLVVGGSPKYHRQLKELVQHHRLTLELVPGNVQRTKKQAASDQSRVALVILWGATILDHSTSALYGDGPARVLRIPHRGIGGMLLRVAGMLNGPA